MVLALTFVLLVSATALVLWGTTAFLQSYLYSEPADKLPVRAVVGGLIVGGFMTLWTYVNTRADTENKYGTLFEFNPVGAKEVTAFEAVRRFPKRNEQGKETKEYREETAPIVRKPGGRPNEFVEDKVGDKFELTNTSKGYLTVALVLDEGGKKAWFEVPLNPTDPNKYAGESREFTEQGGSRTIDGTSPSTVFSPSRLVVIAALSLNALVFVAWFAAFWPVLRYTSGAALGLATVGGLLAVLVLMPLLFDLNKPKPTALTPPPATAPK